MVGAEANGRRSDCGARVAGDCAAGREAEIRPPQDIETGKSKCVASIVSPHGCILCFFNRADLAYPDAYDLYCERFALALSSLSPEILLSSSLRVHLLSLFLLLRMPFPLGTRWQMDFVVSLTPLVATNSHFSTQLSLSIFLSLCL